MILFEFSIKFINSIFSRIPIFNNIYSFLFREIQLRNFAKKQRKDINNILIHKFKIDQDEIDLYLNQYDYRSYLVSLNRQDHKIKYLRDLSKKMGSQTLIDIGANYGEFSGILSNHFQLIYAVEPNPLIKSCLRKTFNNVKLDSSNIKIIDKACTKKSNEIVNFNIDVAYSGGNHIINNKYLENSSFSFFSRNYSIEIETISPEDIIRNALDLIIKRNLKKSISIKIDVEGSEAEILNSIKLFFQKNNQILEGVLIMFEYNSNSYKYKNKIEKNINNFVDLGFECSIIPGPPEKFKKYGIKKIGRNNINKSIQKNCEICLIKNYF